MHHQFYPRMLDATPDALLLTDADGVIRWLNATTERMFGYARQELLGMVVDLLLPAQHRDAHVTHRVRFGAAPHARAMGGHLTLSAMRKDGTEFPVEVSLSPLASDAGAYVLSAVRDVTERRRAELGTARLAAIVDSSDDAIISTTLDGTISSWNAGAARILGYGAEEIVGRPFSVLAPAVAAARDQSEHLARMMQGEQVEPYETIHRRKDGSEVHLSVRISPIRDHAGRVTGVASAARDIGAHRLAEQRARAVGQQLMSAVESFHGMFALFSPDDRITVCNSGFRSFFAAALEGRVDDVTFQELVQRSLQADLFELGDAHPDQLAARWTAQHRGATGSLELRTREGRTLRVTERAAADGSVVCTLWDVTEDIAREAQLHRARAAAESASAAKSEFLASVSHELRTPLNAILGFAQLLERDRKTPLDERQRDRVHHIVKGGEHLLRLIEDVLDFARIEAGQVMISLEPVDLDEVLSEVTSTLEPMAAQRGVRLLIERGPHAPARVHADRVRASQVLLNYASNAIKYGSDGGIVSFRVTRGSEGAVRVSVIDRGKGIALAQQGKLFQPFQRAGQELGPIEGTGIGLVICKRLAAMMRGAVGFHSEPGAGSEFWLELPAHQGAEVTARGARAARMPEPVAGTPDHVVVYIEDNPSNIALMESVMEELGTIELITAHTAELGVALVRAHQPDLVLMDINLPGMSGITAARQLRAATETARIPIVALTAAALVREHKHEELSVFDRCLTKPLRVDQLADTLTSLFARRSARS